MSSEIKVGMFRRVLHNVEVRQNLSLLMEGSVTVAVRRSNLLDDAVRVVNRLSDHDLVRKFQVEFVNDFGEKETELDIRALFKKFLLDVTSEAIDPNAGLFKESDTNRLLYPDPASGRKCRNHLACFEFLGRILGKAMVEGILLDLPFNGFFVKQFLGKVNLSTPDLLYLDPQLHGNLLALRQHQGDLSQLGLYFVTTNEFGELVELEGGGSHIAVSHDNINRYIRLRSDYLLHKRIANELQAFRDGFSQVLELVMYRRYVWMFNVQEITNVLFGSSEPVDVDDLRAHSVYQGYKKDSPVILMLWEVFKGFDDEQRRRLLKFVTEVTKGPYIGFENLLPCLTIARERGDLHQLPTSSACQNLLKLPRYKSKEVLRKKPLQAINTEAGFNLS